MERQVMDGKSKKELVLGVLFILFAALILTQLLKLESQSQELPRLCAYGILVVGVSLIIQTFVKARKSLDETEKEQDGEKKRNIEIFGFSLVLIVIAFLIPIIGFYPMVFMFVTILYLFISKPITKKALRNGLIFGSSVILFFFVVFDMLMKLPVPMGLVF
jgi:Flp pilus assembly protein TadB